MIRVHLTEAKVWKGVIYESGDREVPQDLASLLGIMPPEPEAPKPEKTEPSDVRKPANEPSKSKGKSGSN